MTDPLYGVWIRGFGWLKVGTQPVAFHLRAVADETADIFRGEVRYIDDTLRDLEEKILEQEKAQPTLAERIRRWITKTKPTP